MIVTPPDGGAPVALIVVILLVIAWVPMMAFGLNVYTGAWPFVEILICFAALTTL